MIARYWRIDDSGRMLSIDGIHWAHCCDIDLVQHLEYLLTIGREQFAALKWL